MMDECPKGFDPYKLGNELHAIVVSHGGTYIDILPEFRTVPNPQLGYFAIDGHPNAYGHAMIARFLTDKLARVTFRQLSAAPSRKLDCRQDNNMDSASFEFVLFGLTAAIVSNFSRSSAWRSIVLFVASIVFLGLLAHGLTVFLPLMGFLFFGYGCLLLLERGWSRALRLDSGHRCLRLRMAQEIHVSARINLPPLVLSHPGPFLYFLPCPSLVDRSGR